MNNQHQEVFHCHKLNPFLRAENWSLSYQLCIQCGNRVILSWLLSLATSQKFYADKILNQLSLQKTD